MVIRVRALEKLVKHMQDHKFWEGKRVFLTGHTGFKGGWTALWLKKLGASVKGYSLAPDSKRSLFGIARVAEVIESHIGDIRNFAELAKSMTDFSPEIVIHMAAQPLVINSYSDPVGTYETNIMGTVGLFEAVRHCKSVKAVVNVTTDKCYQNNEWAWGYRENEPMGGADPYSNSKACSELVTSAYRHSFFNHKTNTSLASARAGNVLGGGDWAHHRLIPDALSAFEAGVPVSIRNPDATRPWQHVLEPISGYLMLIEKLYYSENEYAEGWNFGPRDEDNRPVREVMDFLVSQWPTDAAWVSDGAEHGYEANLLKLDISKAKRRLNWTPRWDLKKTLQAVIDWHFAWRTEEDMQAYSLNQIEEFNQVSSFN